jgi:ATP-dependent protease HslVU (ClpYQ) peptidase subunit
MTCIVGMVKDNKVWIGGDSAGSDSSSICIRRDPKVFKNGKFLIGYCGSFRLGQLLHYKFTPPQYPDDKDIFSFMVTDFADAVRELAKDHGILKIEDNVEELEEIQLLIGYNGRLFTLEEDMQIGEVVNEYYAVGEGMDLALGSMHTTGRQKRGYTPKKRLEMALEASATFCKSVAPPFVILGL